MSITCGQWVDLGVRRAARCLCSVRLVYGLRLSGPSRTLFHNNFLPPIICWPKINIWCTFGQNRIIGLEMATDIKKISKKHFLTSENPKTDIPTKNSLSILTITTLSLYFKIQFIYVFYFYLGLQRKTFQLTGKKKPTWVYLYFGREWVCRIRKKVKGRSE